MLLVLLSRLCPRLFLLLGYYILWRHYSISTLNRTSLLLFLEVKASLWSLWHKSLWCLLLHYIHNVLRRNCPRKLSFSRNHGSKGFLLASEWIRGFSCPTVIKGDQLRRLWFDHIVSQRRIPNKRLRYSCCSRLGHWRHLCNSMHF